MNAGLVPGVNGALVPGMNAGLAYGANPRLMAGGLNLPMVAGGGAGFIGQPQFPQVGPWGREVRDDYSTSCNRRVEN